MDDRLLRVGSSNLNNRSMGFDTKCDLTIEVDDASDPQLRASITGLRNDLLAEHLSASNATIERRLDEMGGSLVRAIESLRGQGRSLVPFEPSEYSNVGLNTLGENEHFDPESVSRSWTG